MIKVSVLYPNNEGSTFDIEYYCAKHMPIVREKLGAALKGVAVEHGLAGAAPGSPPPFLALGHLLFESLEDIPNFTNTQPTIQISEVKM